MFSHLDAKNRPAMVNVGDKPVTKRTAHAVAVIALPPALAGLLKDGDIATKKGSIFQTAALAGVMGAKRTSELIPLCHVVALTRVEIAIARRQARDLSHFSSLPRQTRRAAAAVPRASISARPGL